MKEEANMGQAIRGDKRQKLLFPPTPEDWVPADSPARFIASFVERINMKERGFVMSVEGGSGTNFIADDLKLKAWLYAYYNKIYSTRELEKECRENINMIWLTEMTYPDHNTFWRFFDKNRKVFSELLLELTFSASENNQIGFVLHALDGTKIRAQVSNRSGWHKQALEKKLQLLTGGISEVVKEIESVNKEESASFAMSEDFCDEEAQKAGIEQALAKMAAIKRDHLHPFDEDARMIKCSEGTSFCYNAQVVVDDSSGLIVAQDVVNDEADSEMLTPMIEKVEENIGRRALETVADAGYYSPNQLLQAEAKGYEVMVNINKAIEPKDDTKKFHKSNFNLIVERDVIICPLGKELCYKGTRKDRYGKYLERIYRCGCFKGCPERKKCCKGKGGRMITIGPHYRAVINQVEKQNIPEKKRQLKKRKCIVERVFAFIKVVMGFRRFTVRGFEKVRAQFALVCAAFNLHKLYKFWKAGILVFG